MKLIALSTTVTLGHYDTFLQSCLKKENFYGNSGQPSCETNDLGQCNFCTSYHFKFRTGKNRHLFVFQRSQRAQPNSKNFICDIYQATYSSLLSLVIRKKKHTKRDQGEKRKTMDETTQSQRKTTKPGTIKDMPRTNKKVNQTVRINKKMTSAVHEIVLSVKSIVQKSIGSNVKGAQVSFMFTALPKMKRKWN